MGRWAQGLLIVSTGVFVCLCGPLHDGKYDLCFAGILTQAVQTLNSESDEILLLSPVINHPLLRECEL